MKTRTFLIWIVAAALLLAGCSSAVAQQDKPPLRIAWSAWGGWYPLILAEKLGLFQKRGLKVDLQYHDVYGDVPSDYAAGRVDGAMVTPYDTLLLNARQSHDLAPFILETDRTTTADAIVAVPGIKSPADLKGKTLAVAYDSYAEVMVREMLRKNGLTAQDVKLVDIPPEEVPAQLGKTIDAGHTYAPYIAPLVAQGNQILFTGNDVPGLLTDGLIIRSSVLKERPQDVRALIDAFFEAQEWWRNHRIEGSRMIAEAIGLRPEDITDEGIRLLDRADNLRVFSDASAPDSVYSSLNANLKYLLESGTLTLKPDLNQLIDPAYLQ